MLKWKNKKDLVKENFKNSVNRQINDDTKKLEKVLMNKIKEDK